MGGEFWGAFGGRGGGGVRVMGCGNVGGCGGLGWGMGGHEGVWGGRGGGLWGQLGLWGLWGWGLWDPFNPPPFAPPVCRHHAEDRGLHRPAAACS